MTKILNTTPVQIFRKHNEAKEFYYKTGKILEMTEIAGEKIAIIEISNKKVPIKIHSEDFDSVTVGDQVKIFPALIGITSEKLKQYGIVAKKQK